MASNDILKFVPTHSSITGKTVMRLGGDKKLGILTDTMYRAAHKIVWSTMQRAWSLSTDVIAGTHSSGKFPFKDVTGNLYESIGVALIGKSLETGNQFALASFPASKEGFSTTRKSLRKGQVYKQDVYADGTPVDGKPYKGETSRIGSGSGKTERSLMIERIKAANPSSRTHFYNLVAFAAMPYASYVNMKRGREYFQSVIMENIEYSVKRALLEEKW